MKIAEVTQEMIEARKADLRSKGIAAFKICIDKESLDEDQSIARSIAEDWSFFYVCVRSPYARNSKPGNLQFRIFQTVKERPTIPMGYYGEPAFAFECYDGDPVGMAIRMLKEKVKKTYTYTRANGDEIQMRLVKSPEAMEAAKYAAQIEAKKLEIQPTDSPAVVEIKEKIIRLQKKIILAKAVNQYLRKGLSLAPLGIMPEEEAKLKGPEYGQPGFPQWKFTSWNGKIKRLKANLLRG